MVIPKDNEPLPKILEKLIFLDKNIVFFLQKLAKICQKHDFLRSRRIVNSACCTHLRSTNITKIMKNTQKWSKISDIKCGKKSGNIMEKNEKMSTNIYRIFYKCHHSDSPNQMYGVQIQLQYVSLYNQHTPVQGGIPL